MAFTLSERIVNAVGTGEDPAELVVLDTLDNLTATAAELNALAGATSANATTGKAAILGTSGALTIAGALTVGTTAISEAEIGVLDSASAANSGTGKALITGTSGAVTIAGTMTRAGVVAAPVLITDVTTYSVLAADSGKLHIIPDLTSTCTFTLPTGAAGLFWEFVGNGIALDAANWVFDSPAGVFFRGGVTHLDLDAGAGTDELVSVFPNGSSHIHLTVSTPSPVTRLMIFWDGTRYVVNGTVHSNTAPAFS